MLSHKKIAVVGAGHIGGALIGGMLRAKLTASKNIKASRRSKTALAVLKKDWGINVTTANKAAVRGADIVILAVKPQVSPAVITELAAVIRPEQLIISLMAGITAKTIGQKLGQPCPVVRAMPNTPCLVDAGATAIAAGVHAGANDLAIAERIFSSVGMVVTLPESAMDAVTGLSGTGPVYIFMVIEAMIDGGVKMGIPRSVATILATQTVLGAAKLVQETGKHPAILKDEVTTPGGTAINAIHVLEAKGLRSVLIDAIMTATQRSQELSRLYGD